MSFTYLKKEEKIRSLMYATTNELSTDTAIQNKQLELLEILYKYYIRECDYSYILNIKKTDRFNIVYTYEWPDKMDLTNLDRLLCEFVYRTETYIQIFKALHYELSNTCRPTLSQQKFVSKFTEYYDDWFTYDVEYFINMYKSKFLLDQFIALKNDTMLAY